VYIPSVFPYKLQKPKKVLFLFYKQNTLWHLCSKQNAYRQKETIALPISLQIDKPEKLAILKGSKRSMVP
jgi:hypothetical protein